MLINYKKIGDTLTDSELNAYASLIAHNKVLKDSFKLKNGVITGVYGNYEFDLTNASIVDNGILITDETLSNNITVKLTNPTQYATYTLHFTVIRYGDVNILDETTENIETFDLTVDLITDTTINIPLTDLQEYDVILFNSNITIKHDKPEIIGKYITALDITGDKSIIQTSETSTLEITATDLEHLPMPNKTIHLLKNNSLLDTLVTDSQGKCSYTYTGIGAGKQDFIAKYRGLQSETCSILDCIICDINNSLAVSDYNLRYDTDSLTIAEDGKKFHSTQTTGRRVYLPLNNLTKCIIELEAKYSTNGNIGVTGENTNILSYGQFNNTEWLYIRMTHTNGTLTMETSTDGVTWTSKSLSQSSISVIGNIMVTVSNGDCYFRNIKIYPI